MDNQEKFRNALVDKRNICLTGGGGVGKSYLIMQLYEHQQKRNKIKIALTASTGLAAMNLHKDASTIHSFTGMGTKNKLTDITSIVNSSDWKLTKDRIKSYNVIVIDEISMIRADQFELIDHIFRRATGRKHVPFGGKQLIVSGDFCQLPPVVTQYEKEDVKVVWAFKGQSWKDANFEVINLTEVKRQSDKVFIDALNKVRFGNCDADVKEVFSNRYNVDFPDGIKPLRILPTNRKVDRWNDFELNKLDSAEYCNVGTIMARNNTVLKMFEKNCNTPKELELKVGCQVMITKNGFCKYGTSKYKFKIPTAFTNHLKKMKNVKDYVVSYSNGSMAKFIDVVSLNRLFSEYGVLLDECCYNIRLGGNQEIIVLETIQSKEIILLGIHEHYTCSNNKGLKFINPELTKWNGDILTERDFTFVGEEFDVRFRQFPLRLAYAITVHKSQGMTVDYAYINCRGMFAEGQMYVALSRVKSLEGLQLENFNPEYIMANEDAIEFYKGLEQ